MKHFNFLAAVLFTLLLSAFTFVNGPDWQLTDGYSIRVKGKKINGFFHKLNGKISFDENNLSSAKVNLEVEVASLTTGNSLKSWHAKRKKWFDAKNYPTINFTSTKFQKSGRGYLVTGKLKMKGVEKEISIPFSFSNNIFFGSFKVLRTDYKVGTMKGMARLVGDTILIDFTIPVTR